MRYNLSLIVISTTATLIIILGFFLMNSQSEEEKGNILLRKALDLSKTGNFSEAIEIYDQILEIDPANYKAFRGKGWCYIMMGNYGAAETHFLKSTITEPKDAAILPYHSLNGLGFIYLNEEQYPKAEKYFRECIQRYPSSPDCHYGLGLACESLGKLNESIKALNNAVALNASRWNYYARSRVLYKLNEK